MSRPHSNEYWVVFPLDTLNRSYTYIDYSPQMLKGRISPEAVEKVILEINLMLTASKSKLQKTFSFMFVGVLLVTLLILGAILVPVLTETFPDPTWIILESFVLIVIWVGMIAAIFIYLIRLSNQVIKKTE